MAKLTLADIAGGYLIPANYNANNTLIENALENTLSRDGTSPNTMLASLDMNSNRIINLPSPATSTEPARLVDIQNGVSVAIAPSQIGNGGRFLKTDGSVATWADIPAIPIAQISKSVNYTFVLADANTQILHPSSDNNPRTFTIDSNANVAYPIGTTLTFINEINTVTISITSDTLVLAGSGATGSRTLAANSIATAIKKTTTSWIISGVGVS